MDGRFTDPADDVTHGAFVSPLLPNIDGLRINQRAPACTASDR